MLNRTLIILANALILYGVNGIAVGAQGSSPSYRIDESYIGPGGSVESSSASYKESSSLGDTGVGGAASTAYQQVAGFNTTNEPRLVMIVDTTSINFGQLSTAVATTATSTFKVLNYTSSGYSVFTVGSPPTNSGHSLAGINPTGASVVGTEQFGINLVANTSPVAVGANPVQVPSGSFSFGAAAAGYNTANNYRYVNGEAVAQSVKTSGQTDYTVTYLINVANNTPGGSYIGGQALVVVGSY